MSCDPLARATGGTFTCKGANCNPCTIASGGNFVFDEEKLLIKEGAGRGRRRKGFWYFQDKADKKKEEKDFLVEHEGQEVQVKRKPIVKTSEIIHVDAVPLTDIEDPVTREIAKIIRKQQTMENNRLILMEQAANMQAEEEIAIMIIASIA